MTPLGPTRSKSVSRCVGLFASKSVVSEKPQVLRAESQRHKNPTSHLDESGLTHMEQ